MDLQETLRSYINNESEEFEFYKQLAEEAPDEKSQQMLCDMSNDAKRHSEEFKVLYQGITGDVYNPQITKSLQRMPYREALQDSVIREGNNYRRYMSHYNRSSGIGDALLLGSLFGAGNDKLFNSIALLYLLGRV